MKFKINIIACLFLIASTSLVAQVKSVVPGKDFTSIRVSTGLFVEIVTNADEHKIEIKGLERDKVNIDIKNGELDLSLPLGQIFTEAEILVTVYAKEVEELKARNGSEVEFISVVDQKELRLIASEGSYIGGELKLESLSVKSVTGASISLVGTAKTTSVEVKTGGSYDGDDLISETTSVGVSYGGEATVHATETCSASVTAGGSIEIHGNPSTLSQKTKLGGNIEVIKKM
ncbi:head GIN domain-containing protein [Psychroflexus lacisalsi]|jgi:hypothetical protein|uniref:Putative auto-transporter adhesin head GIN domain-containing protein n=1 Tax=Psychroflexus lacisalsi TaxID=503928 RepID=A0ABN1K249_9FLAO|nr:head GIN domain-containing protein [Psychroflexus lacisalsi]MBZ9621100.1 DUF2807 domain-containing protein [Psychroflexus lacisalsi]